MCVCVQVDPTGSGRVAAADAALFLKRSGLADLVLGKVSKWSSQGSNITSLFPVLCVCVYVDGHQCVCLRRSGIWQTLNAKVPLTNRYKCKS